MAITTLFLDIGGVLLTNGWGHESRHRAAEEFDLDYDEMQSRHHLTFATYEVGKLSLDDYLSRVVFYQERSFTRDEFKEFMFGCSKPVPEMLEMIRSLRARHRLAIAAVSNEGRELTEHRIRAFDLKSLFDFFISSCFVHIRKPDRDIYRLALDVAQVDSGNVVYVDDRAMFIQVAEGLGMVGIHHTGAEPTRAALASMGLSL